jgi:riboflavin biosynthesis pyrimidine reductase
MPGSPAEVVRRLESRGMGHLYIDGGKVIQAFLNEGLIDRMIRLERALRPFIEKLRN